MISVLSNSSVLSNIPFIYVIKNMCGFVSTFFKLKSNPFIIRAFFILFASSISIGINVNAIEIISEIFLIFILNIFNG